jgi:hypothetical protein
VAECPTYLHAIVVGDLDDRIKPERVPIEIGDGSPVRGLPDERETNSPI